jgi:predicted PurR-regulated permease PerM
VEPDKGHLLESPLVVRAARLGILAWTAIGVLLLAFWGYHYMVEPVRVVFPPLIVATVIVYLLNPLVSGLERRGLRRGWATFLTYIVFFLSLGLAARLLAPVISRQVSAFVVTVPGLVSRAGMWAQDLAAKAHLDWKVADLTAQLQIKQGLSFFGRVASFTGGVIHAAVILILGPILAFYLLVDLPKLQRGVTAAIPARRRDEVQDVGHQLSVSVGGFFRGQLLVALFVGLASMLALWIVGLPYWALVGVICGIFNLVPLIGPYIAAVPAVFIAFTTPVSGGLMHVQPGWPLAIAASLALLIVQQIDNHIISPNVVARTVKLHPVTVMLSLLAGGTLFGLWGMLFAVPTVAAFKILFMHWWDTRASWPPNEPLLSEADVPPSPPPEVAAEPQGVRARPRITLPKLPTFLRRKR